MTYQQRNLFEVLSHYGSTEEENYLTESFAYLLRLFCERIPQASIGLINNLTGPLPLHPITDPKSVHVITQKDLGTFGRVDLAIEEGEDTLILIEIKHDSPLHKGQLENYYQALEKTEKNNNRLVLLKRHRDSCFETELNSQQFHCITWFDVHRWLHQIEHADDVLQFLIQEFLSFLEEKNMSLKKVSWEYIQGIPALLDLRNMLEIAKNEVMPDLLLRRTQGWTWVGLYINNHFFFGLRYEKPLIIVYENNFGNRATSEMTMDLEKKHFFSHSAEEQLEILIDFLKQASQAVKRGDAKVSPPEGESEN